MGPPHFCGGCAVLLVQHAPQCWISKGGEGICPEGQILRGLGLPKSIDPHITERVRLPNHRPHLDSPQLLCGLSSSPTPLAAGLKAEMGGPVEWLRETRSVLSVTSRSLRRLPSKIQMKREKHGNNPQPTSKATPDLSRNRRTARPQKRAW